MFLIANLWLTGCFILSVDRQLSTDTKTPKDFYLISENHLQLKPKILQLQKTKYLFSNYTFFPPGLMQVLFKSSMPLWDADVTIWSCLRSGSRAGEGHAWGWFFLVTGEVGPEPGSLPVERNRTPQCSKVSGGNKQLCSNAVLPQVHSRVFCSLSAGVSFSFSLLFSIYVSNWLLLISNCLYF